MRVAILRPSAHHPSTPHSDETYFQKRTSQTGAQDNWVLRFSALKKLYRLMTTYFSEVLHQPTGALEVPDLQAIAKDYNVNATLTMCRLTIAIAVQCENNKEIIERIQKLTESEQHSLMRVIEQVRAGLLLGRSESDAGLWWVDHDEG